MRAPRATTRTATGLATLLGALALGPLTAALQADILDDVIARGRVRCGFGPELPGFAVTNSLGSWSGFDVDLCRAVAAAVLGDENAIEAVPLDAGARRDALASGRVDLLTRESGQPPPARGPREPWIGPLLHDGQSFLVPRSRGIRSALELDGLRVCVVDEAERSLGDYFRAAGMTLRPRVARDAATAFGDYLDGRCDALTGDRTTLAARRATLERPDRHLFLVETITKRPLGLRVAAADPIWEDIVRWTRHCLVGADELGIDSDNAIARAREGTLAVRVLLGLEGGTGAALGIRPDWCASVVSRVGNHGELHSRHLGPDTPLGLERGLDAPWTEGGLLYALPPR